jgi:hypothetical protein
MIASVTIRDGGCDLDPDPLGPLSAGPIAVTAVNASAAPGGFHIWHIDEPATFEDLAAHVTEEIELAGAGQPGLGHPDFVSDLIDSTLLGPGESALVQGVTQPGTYGIVCASADSLDDEPRPSAVLGPINVR